MPTYKSFSCCPICSSLSTGARKPCVDNIHGNPTGNRSQSSSPFCEEAWTINSDGGINVCCHSWSVMTQEWESHVFSFCKTTGLTKDTWPSSEAFFTSEKLMWCSFPSGSPCACFLCRGLPCEGVAFGRTLWSFIWSSLIIETDKMIMSDIIRKTSFRSSMPLLQCTQLTSSETLNSSGNTTQQLPKHRMSVHLCGYIHSLWPGKRI